MFSPLFPEPSNLSDYPYLGWIPCVSGHLDFCLTSVGLSGSFLNGNKKDKSAKTVNFSSDGLWDTHRKRIILKSWVDWRDAISGDGKTQVIVIAECTKAENLDQRSMSGRVLIFPESYREKHSTQVESLTDQIDSMSVTNEKFKLLANEELQFSTWQNTQDILNSNWADLHAKISSNRPLEDPIDNVFIVDFHINHSGFVFLKYSETDRPSDPETKEGDRYVITRQAYYYLKYALHKHNHHVEEADCLTTIVHHTKQNRTNIGLKLVGQLKRELVNIKRIQRKFQRRRGETEALGILGYMRSLLASCHEQGYLDKKRYRRELEWLAGMHESFSSQHDSIQVETNHKNTARQFHTQGAALFLALISLGSLVYLRLHPPQFFETVDSSRGGIVEFQLNVTETTEMTSNSELELTASPSSLSNNTVEIARQHSGSTRGKVAGAGTITLTPESPAPADNPKNFFIEQLDTPFEALRTIIGFITLFWLWARWGVWWVLLDRQHPLVVRWIATTSWKTISVGTAAVILTIVTALYVSLQF